MTTKTELGPGDKAASSIHENVPAVNPHVEEAPEALKVSELPSTEEPIEALGIPNWRELEKKIVHRLDMTLMPCLIVLYLFNYLDRASIAQARISTLDEDLGLKGYQFSTAVSILSVGYVIGQIPSNMIIGYLRPSLYLPLCALVWSGVSAATCGVKNYQGLVAVRFMLGIVEAPLFPGAVYVMSCWYTRREMALRVAFLYTGLTLAQASSGLIAAGVFASLEGALGMAGWQWLFIILAAVGSFLALICIFILPDYPSSKTGSAMWSMTEDMRKIAAARILADRVSVSEGKHGPWYGLKMCLKDYKTWILVIMNLSLSAAYGFSNFFPAIVRGLGFSSRTTVLLLMAPPYLFAAAGSLINAWHSDRTRERGFHFATPVTVGIVGYIVCLATTNTSARYAAAFLYVGGMFIANPLVNVWITGTLSKTPEKRAVAVALINVLGQIGNFIAPYFFDDGDEPRYQRAFILMLMFGALAIICALTLKFFLHRSNKRLAEKALREGTVYNPYIL